MTVIDVKRAEKSHIWKREANEHYVEEMWCSRRLFDTEKFDGSVLDPACGFGRIVEAASRAGLTVAGSDIVARAPMYPVEDYFTNTAMAENVVSNPPFKPFKAFALHALAHTTKKVALIWQVPRLNAARWLEQTPLARVLLLTPRPSMPPGWAIMAGNMPNGDKPQGGTQDFCWLIWDHSHTGPATVGWLKRDAEL